MALTPLTRLDRDGRVSLAAPLRQPPSVAYLIARDIASILLVPAAIILVVWLVAGEGFETSVPVQSVEEDDGPSSEVGP